MGVLVSGERGLGAKGAVDDYAEQRGRARPGLGSGRNFVMPGERAEGRCNWPSALIS